MSLFGWWKPQCPVGFREKAWIEHGMRWLADRLGPRQLIQCRILLPTEEYFPDEYEPTPEAVRRLFDRLCDHVGVPSGEFAIEIETESCRCSSAEASNSSILRLTESQMEDPAALVATFAYALAQRHLERHQLLEGLPNPRWMVELATVFLGLGVFTANAANSEKHKHCGGSCHDSGARQGLPAWATAYAMALQAWLRGERRPTWGSYLREDAAYAFSAGLRYLERTEDSLLRPDNLYQESRTPSVRQLIDKLREGSLSDCVAALWELGKQEQAAGEALSAVIECLNHRQSGICAEAARTLAAWGSSAEAAIPALADSLGHHAEEVRTASAYALGRIHLRPEHIVETLAESLDDPYMFETAAWALAQYGASAEPALPKLLGRLKQQLGYGDGAIDFLVYAVRAITPEAETEIQQVIESCDGDLQRQVVGILPEVGGAIPNPPGSSSLWFWGAS